MPSGAMPIVLAPLALGPQAQSRSRSRTRHALNNLSPHDAPLHRHWEGKSMGLALRPPGTRDLRDPSLSGGERSPSSLEPGCPGERRGCPASLLGDSLSSWYLSFPASPVGWVPIPWVAELTEVHYPA